MGTVCSGLLTLLDAGVPVKGNVADIAMDLIKRGDGVAILPNILRDGDHLVDIVIPDFEIHHHALPRMHVPARFSLDGFILKASGVLSRQRVPQYEYQELVGSVSLALAGDK